MAHRKNDASINEEQELRKYNLLSLWMQGKGKARIQKYFVK